MVPAGYGLQFPGGKPPSLVRAKPEEQQQQQPLQHQDKAKPRAKHVSAKLTEEERAARLEAMRQDAVAVAKDRGKRVLTAEEEERKEEAERAAISAEPATFIRDLNRKVFTEEETRLGDRMAATRHTRSRNAIE